MKNYIYIHICCINNWVDIVSKLLFKIKDSSLYDKISEIRCSILGNYDTENGRTLFNDPKIKIIYNSDNLSLHEPITINRIHEDATYEDFNVLYLHSKGVNTNGQNSCILDWVNLLHRLKRKMRQNEQKI